MAITSGSFIIGIPLELDEELVLDEEFDEFEEELLELDEELLELELAWLPELDDDVLLEEVDSPPQALSKKISVKTNADVHLESM
jgi:hypothetical protein